MPAQLRRCAGDLGPEGVAVTLHVHFDNNTLPAVRIDAAVAKRAADDFEAKIKNQTHDPAQAMRQQLLMLEQRLRKMGAVKEAKFSPKSCFQVMDEDREWIDAPLRVEEILGSCISPTRVISCPSISIPVTNNCLTS